MTVQELIDQLSQFPKDKQIQFTCSIESGRSLDICNEGGFYCELEDDFEYYNEETEEEVKVGDVLILGVSGEVTSSQ